MHQLLILFGMVKIVFVILDFQSLVLIVSALD